ncbi:MAG TPA: tRNA-(ms[2]io[6]A)-hydroxylase [Gammaproteobacteria bacterium]
MNSQADMGPVLAFLRCRTPSAWIERAAADLDTLLADHASLELKAAQQAQKLIRKYGSYRDSDSFTFADSFRIRLVQKMSRLAREELRHFEQVVALIERRGGTYTTVSPSRYAAGLHELARSGEPDALIDALIIGSVIEARSCERFFSLVSSPQGLDEATARFYKSLLRSEARHFEDYLGLARSVDARDIEDRVDAFLDRDAELVLSADTHLRFHSGVPARAAAGGDARG